jgi:hypothetical protein
MKTYECQINNCYPTIKARNIISALLKLIKAYSCKTDKSLYLEIRIKEKSNE